MTKGTYQTTKKQYTTAIHPGSYLAKREPDWVVFDEMVKTTREYMKNVIEVNPAWLLEVAPFYFTTKEIQEPEKTPNLQRVLAGQGLKNG